MPIDCHYEEPKTVAQCCQLLARHKGDAKLVAGGQNVMLLLRQRLIQPKVLISLRQLPRLDAIEAKDGSGLRIGALVTLRQIERSDVVVRKLPALAEVCASIGDVQIRNLGTLVGNLCEANPRSDLAALLLALNAKVMAVSKRGRRQIAIDNFLLGNGKTSLRPDELLTEIIIPPHPPRTGSAYVRFAIRDGDFPIVGAAAVVTLDDKGTCKAARLAFTSVSDRPVRSPKAERALIGKKLDSDTIRAAADAAKQEIECKGEPMASPDYERHLVGVLSRYALEKAAERAERAKVRRREHGKVSAKPQRQRRSVRRARGRS